MSVSRLSLVTLLVLAAAAAGCSDQAQPPNTNRETRTTTLDGIQWPDFGPLPDTHTLQRDGQVPLPDTTPADAVSDSTAAGDGPPSCPGPAAAKCVSACAADEICTEAKGGTCVKQLVLKGAATDKAVLKVVAMGFVTCWNKSPSSDTLCSAFNTCGMTGSLTKAIVDDWICGKAQVSDFPSSTEYDLARSLFKCNGIWEFYRPDWKISTIISGKRGIICLTYDNRLLGTSVLNINDCQYFPPS